MSYSEPWLICNPRHLQKSVGHVSRSSYSESWHHQHSLFKRFQRYLGIFRDIDTYSVTHRRATIGEREEVSSVFFKNQKKGPDCVHIWFKICKNIKLVEKAQKCFPVGLFFLVFDKMFIEVP